MKTIYFDNAATTYPKPESVYKAMDNGIREIGVNIGRSSYKQAIKAYKIYDETKKMLINLSNCGGEVVFTASATNAFNKIIFGLNIEKNANVYIDPMIHNAVARPLRYYSNLNSFNIHIIPYKDMEMVDIKKLTHMCSINKPDYLFMNYLSNVTGVTIESEKIINIFSNYKSIIIVDAAQALGLVNIDMIHEKIDILVFAGHKTLYGPFGIAGYITNRRKRLSSLTFGGTGSDSLNMEVFNELEVGSPNINAIIGLNASLKWINEVGIDTIRKHKIELTKYLIEKLEEIDDVTVFKSVNEDRQIGIVSINYREYEPDILAQILDEDFNIAVRSGFHCAPYVHDLLGTKNKGGTLRISLSYFNTYEDLNYLIEKLNEL